MIFLEMFGRFFLVGLFSIGGGLATLPFLTSMGDATGWFTHADISDMVAISESTPGPLGINMATYVGFKVGSQYSVGFGFLGSVVSTIGLVLPSLIIIILISRILTKFRDSKYVNNAFYGLRAASVGLISAACLGVAKIAMYDSSAFAQTGNFFLAVDYKSIILCVVVFALVTKFKKIHPIIFIAASAVIGIIFHM